MPGIEKSGNSTHDAAVLASEKTLQAALAAASTQLAVNNAYTAYWATARDSANTNGLTAQAAYYENARRQLAAYGSGTPHA